MYILTQNSTFGIIKNRADYCFDKKVYQYVGIKLSLLLSFIRLYQKKCK